MESANQGFPDDRDRELQRMAERTGQIADDLVEWAGKHVASRQESDYAVSPDEEFSLYRLRRLASNLWRSANVPVAAAVYGPSQVGKSLFVGRVLEPAAEGDTPLGKCDQLGPPGYIRNLSFHYDINPQAGAKEATALVTRFTTKERFDEKALPEYPVKVRALTRAEWLRVLARGYRSECQQDEDAAWRESQIRDLFDAVSRDHAGDAVDRDWRMDLLDVYAYLRHLDHLRYEVSESMFNSFLSQYPLTESGYVEIAGRMFWNHGKYPELTALFNDVCRFLRKITRDGRDGILVHWAALRFLLDSQRSAAHDSEKSLWQQRVAWQDLRDDFKDGWYVLDYAPGGRGPSEDLAIIQAAMLEMIIPVVPHRLSDDWKSVILKMDILDLPGMRAGGGGDARGGASALDNVDRKMNVVKRGKVFYLIDRYIEERQVQTLLLLVRGLNLEVRSLLKEYVDKWGRARYGDDVWPHNVVTSQPALFIGMTGVDEEFKDRELNRALYDNRLKELVDATFFEVMTHFGGQPFTNVYPIRYPGTWDWDESTRCNSPWSKNWDKAGEAFVESPMVRTYVSEPVKKWEVAMRDGDGGLSLISRGFVGCTDSTQKQETLDSQIRRIRQDLKNLAERWFCDPDANKDRETRLAAAARVLRWLDDPEWVYERVHALRAALCFEEGDAMEVAEFPEMRSARSRTRPESLEQRFPKFLKEFLNTWARELAVKRWREHTERNANGSVWLPFEDFSLLARYLCDYLCCEAVFRDLQTRLLEVLSLKIRDAGDRRHAQREYIRVILNDFVMNPGPDDEPAKAADTDDDRDFGLMKPFIRRWRSRLPEALAAAAGAHQQIPSGNDELQQLLHKF